eukprot:TRINITY_DN8480_c0_g1_i1.p1 TRINITY_DN8480_c0_g1~~TRINITY_DN8480_c0_g1_i1.p1  ORF type:complete len:371 (+),score=149.10 TRINITY_DN8480_c0_g1_i1:52-1113(+)
MPRRKREEVTVAAVSAAIAVWGSGRDVVSMGDLERFLDSWTPKMRVEMGCTKEMLDRAFIAADKEGKGVLTAHGLQGILNRGDEFAGVWRLLMRMTEPEERPAMMTPSPPAKFKTPPTKPTARQRQRASSENFSESSQSQAAGSTPSMDWVVEEHMHFTLTPKTEAEEVAMLPALPRLSVVTGSDMADLPVNYKYTGKKPGPSPPQRPAHRRFSRPVVAGATFRPMLQQQVKVIKVVNHLHPKPFVSHFTPEDNFNSKLRSFRDEYHGHAKYDDTPLPPFSRRGLPTPAHPLFKADFNMRKKLPFDSRAETLREARHEDNVILSTATHAITPREVDRKVPEGEASGRQRFLLA